MLGLALLAISCASDGTGPSSTGSTAVTLDTLPPERRLAYLREAEAWAPIDTGSLDLHHGPDGSLWPAGATIECDFVLPEEEPSGYTAKFFCGASNGKTYKIKYGRENREVYGEVIGSRLLWALGFRSDRFSPVVVKCRGCPEDPWDYMKGLSPWDPAELPERRDVLSFEPAIIESYYGTLMESEPEEGVAWGDLLTETSRDPARAREQRVHREALALLMGFLQHADSKPSQQTLSCAPGAVRRDARGGESCAKAGLYVGDVGAILGDGWKYKRISTSKIDFARWKDTPIWEDAAQCIVQVNERPNASLHPLPVSEAARSFLAGRLSLLSREQVHAMFSTARVELLAEEIEEPPGTHRTVTVDDWVQVFFDKTAEIIDHTCPSAVAAG